MLGVLATCLFYGDAMITPAISVLSAVEGLTIVEAELAAAGASRSRSASWSACSWSSRAARPRSARIFGPVILVYFAVLAALGVSNIIGAPGDPRQRSARSGRSQFFAATTRSSPSSRWARCSSRSPGAETLYADMGHFGRKAIGCSLAGARLSVPDAQLHGPGRAAARQPGGGRESLLPDGAGLGAAAAGRASPRRRRSSPARR